MNKTVPSFWLRWIQLLCLMLILYGVAMVVAPQMMNSRLIGPILYQSGSLHNAFTTLAGPDQTFVNVLNGLIGAVTMGYAILLGWVTLEPFRKGETWAWNAITIGLVVWAILEAYVKLINGLGIQSFLHFGLLVAFGIPLVATYRMFHEKV